MAETILSGIVAADKSSSNSFNTLVKGESHSPAPASNAAHLGKCLKAEIQAVIGQQVNIALGAFVAAFIGSSEPGGEGQMPTLLRADMQVDAPLPCKGDVPATVGLLGVEMPGHVIQDRAARSLKLSSIPTDGDGLQPLVFVADGTDRSEFGKEPVLQRPGIYLSVWDDRAYVGMGKRVGTRVATNDRLRGASRIYCIADSRNHMTPAQALVCERLLAQTVSRSTNLHLAQSMPSGAPVELEDYDAGRLFVAQACLALRKNGFLFGDLPAAALLVPPTAQPQREELDERATIYAIATPGIRAHVIEHEDGWLLLKGSEVRIEVRSSAYGPATMLRTELLHSGALLQTGNVLTTTQHLLFSSQWAAAHFILGGKPRSDIWKPMAAPIAPAPLSR